MDIDEWEFLPDNGYLDFNEDGEKQSFLGKGNLESKSVFDMNYFCSSPQSSRRITEQQRKQGVRNQLVPLPILLEPRIGKAPDDDELVKDITTENHPMEVTIVTPPTTSSSTKDLKLGPVVVEADQEAVSQVFFKIKENEFVDMKVESPKSSSSRVLWPPMDAGGGLKFEDKGEAMEIITSPRKKIEKDMTGNKEVDSTWEEESNNGFNLWKWSLTGVGAICTFGVAAATICVLFFGSQQRKKHQQDQKIRFQIYTDDKRIKQVVQHATKLNEAISAARSVPISRAHITIGGYYDSL